MIEAMHSFKRPNTKNQLKSFIGYISYYKRFAPGLANLTSILNKVTGKSSPRVVCWTPEIDCAFQKMCECLCNNEILCIPSQSDSFELHTDASSQGIGECSTSTGVIESYLLLSIHINTVVPNRIIVSLS